MTVTNFPNGLSTSTLTTTGAITIAGAAGITGVISGPVRQPTQELTASGAITLTSGLVMLNHATVAIAATLAAPTAGDVLWIVNTSASGIAAHTVTLAAGTWDGTNDVATLNAPGEALLVIATSATRFFIVVNVGAVAFS